MDSEYRTSNHIRVNVLFEAVNEEAVPDLVTVAVSLYNYSQYIIGCLQSILQQQHRPVDLIIVDDASTDTSVESARAWLETNHSRFRRATLLSHKTNQGLAQARNTAFEYSRSNLVFVVDADNELYPRAISRLFDTMKNNEVGAAYCQLEKFGDEHAIGSGDIWSKQHFTPWNYIDAMALVSRSAWSAVGGYTQMWGLEDYDFWCKFIDAGIAAIFVPQILCRYRVHKSSMLKVENTAYTETKRTLMLRHPWITPIH